MSTVIVLKRCSTRVGYGRVDSGGVVPAVRPELIIAKPAAHDSKIRVPRLAGCESPNSLCASAVAIGKSQG